MTAAARLKFDMLEFGGRNAAAAADRKISAWASDSAARRAAYQFWQDPRLPPGGRGDAF